MGKYLGLLWSNTYANPYGSDNADARKWVEAVNKYYPYLPEMSSACPLPKNPPVPGPGWVNLVLGEDEDANHALDSDDRADLWQYIQERHVPHDEAWKLRSAACAAPPCPACPQCPAPSTCPPQKERPTCPACPACPPPEAEKPPAANGGSVTRAQAGSASAGTFLWVAGTVSLLFIVARYLR
jgi:hypothetical protein